MYKGKWFMAVLCGVLSVVETKPTCKLRKNEAQFLECTPGNNEYILTRGLVSDNDQTLSIALKGCRISKLSRDCLEGLPSLEKLDISHNKIETLPLGVLDKVTNLKNLNMSYNFLMDLPAGLFDHISNLIELDLTGNHLMHLNPGLFKKVSLLYLSKNALRGKDLHHNVFETSEVNFLLFAENNMLGAPDALLQTQKELVYLNLDGCSLTELPKFLATQNLNTINHLTLADNKIREIKDAVIFSNLNDLEVLNLSKNIIENINDSIFTSLKKLKTLDLSMNRLNRISDYLFQNSPALSKINLSKNLITKLPVNAFRGTVLRSLNLSDNRITFLQDNFCLELKNSGAVLTKLYFSSNPWQCACLKQLLKEVKAMNIKYDDEIFDGMHPVCVTTMEFVCKRQDYDNQVYIDLYNDITQTNIIH